MIHKDEILEKSYIAEESTIINIKDSTSLTNSNISINSVFTISYQGINYLSKDTLRIIKKGNVKSIYIKELSNG